MKIEDIRKDFPILNKTVYDRPLIYLDNAATTQVPVQVLDAYRDVYLKENGNIHRGAHYLANAATNHYEEARKKVASFLGAKTEKSIVFTSGATDGLNYVSYAIEKFIANGDRIVLTTSEHNSNYLPWKRLAKEKGAELIEIPSKDGRVDLEAVRSEIEKGAKLVAMSWVTNLTGEVLPVKEIIGWAKKAGAITVVDGAQAIRHASINLEDLGCDFFCSSGHKMMSTSGTGILYIGERLLYELEPVKLGGGMVDDAENMTWLEPPYCFEAGTPNFQGVIALSRAIDYMKEIGLEYIYEREKNLLGLAEKKLAMVPEINIVGKPKERAGAISFAVDGIHSYDIAMLSDKQGLALRSGHVCAMRQLEDYGLSSIVRLSPAFYNTEEEIEQAVEIIRKTISLIK